MADAPSRNNLLKSIKPNMKLTESVFKQIYAYELTWPGFSEIALKKLEEAGSSNARRYYEKFSKQYIEERKRVFALGGEYIVEKRRSDVIQEVDDKYGKSRNINKRKDRFRTISQDW